MTDTERLEAELMVKIIEADTMRQHFTVSETVVASLEAEIGRYGDIEAKLIDEITRLRAALEQLTDESYKLVESRDRVESMRRIAREALNDE